MYDGKMFIFGGDRNKYPFNDIFFFEYEKCKNKEEMENNNGQTKNTVESKTSRYDN